ncbi:MAG TPA: Asp-tRNA(Asn)/Glu-tRNA(Gln) amidotransferase subunit GatB [Candidatus Paceibacterota bacterium]
MTDYIPTIGLEIHAELKTQTKMFCNSKNDPGERRPNVNICPICLAHPGSLPTINREAVRQVLRVGLALNGKLAEYTEFDRKNYFYPDLPKGYQISQYEYPLVTGGTLNDIAITRVHLEEDTASSMHDDQSGMTTIDYNRAGVPLMELVTEPVIRSSEEAGNVAQELQLLLRYLGASEANMEKGEMRVEANVSISRTSELGTKIEIKNLNSFRTMERAIAYEIERQKQLLEDGQKVTQETRGWDDRIQKTFPQRIKEESADYRYFPDPDLPSLFISEIAEFNSQELLRLLPELPASRRSRYLAIGIKEADATLFVKEPILGSYFDSVIEAYKADIDAMLLAANYIANDLVNLIRESVPKESRDTEKRDTGMYSEIPISGNNFREIIDLLLEKKLSSRAAKDLLKIAFYEQKSPRELATSMNLLKQEGASLEEAVLKAIESNKRVVSDYKAGKEAALGFLVGVVMKDLRGAGDPVVIREMLKTKVQPE